MEVISYKCSLPTLGAVPVRKGWGLRVCHISSVQSLSCVQLFATPWTAAHHASLSITNSWSFLKLMSITLVMPSNHLILCRPLLLPPSIFPSIRVFSNESVLHIRWPEYWTCSISPSNEHPGLISFRMDWLDLLAVQETLKSLLQHHSSKDQFFSGSKTNAHSHVENDIRLEGPGSFCRLIPSVNLALFLAHIHVLLSQLLS